MAQYEPSQGYTIFMFVVISTFWFLLAFVFVLRGVFRVLEMLWDLCKKYLTIESWNRLTGHYFTSQPIDVELLERWLEAGKQEMLDQFLRFGPDNLREACQEAGLQWDNQRSTIHPQTTAEELAKIDEEWVSFRGKLREERIRILRERYEAEVTQEARNSWIDFFRQEERPRIEEELRKELLMYLARSARSSRRG